MSSCGSFVRYPRGDLKGPAALAIVGTLQGVALVNELVPLGQSAPTIGFETNPLKNVRSGRTERELELEHANRRVACLESEVRFGQMVAPKITGVDSLHGTASRGVAPMSMKPGLGETS